MSMRLWLRIGFVAVSASLAALATSQTGALGTKKDVVTASVEAPPSGGALPGMQLLQMLVAVAIVVAILKFVLPKFIGRANRRLQPTLGSSIKLEESATFSGGNLVVVTARSKTLLLCVSPQGVTCLSDLTETPSQQAEGRAFFEVLDEAAPPTAAVRIAEAPNADLDARDIQGALDRLARLTG